MQVMSSEVETGSPRPRPLSGGFWSLLSWLRGEDHHTSSSESISSAGSDRTAVSFAFLAPAHYQGTSDPITLPPPGPPTDSYKKRVYERNIRRQFDRDITLHRKYGLYRGEGSNNYDAFSLPSARKTTGIVGDRQDRDRRATSECVQRRAAHVPGKRRAPPPPTRVCSRAISLGPTDSIHRRHTRKRPAPQPPNCALGNSKEDLVLNHSDNQVSLMSSQRSRNLQKNERNDVVMDCKSEKYTKKENDVKGKKDKNFLKQIFENRKRSSAVDISLVKVLPSISELDKQAAEIIQTSKTKQLNESKQESYKLPENIIHCPKCSKTYDQSKNVCLHCKTNQDVLLSNASKIHTNASACTQTENNRWQKPSTSGINIDEEKIKLKEMLKEMKDSLPKRPKHDQNKSEISRNNNKSLFHDAKQTTSHEAPTLRIGSKIDNNSDAFLPINRISNKNVLNTRDKNYRQIESKFEISVNDKCKSKEVLCGKPVTPVPQEKNASKDVLINDQSDKFNKKRNIHTPLKISALLNPIYISKADATQDHASLFPSFLKTEPKKANVEKKPIQAENNPIYIKTADAVRQILLDSPQSTQSVHNPSLNYQKKISETRFDIKHEIQEQNSTPVDKLSKTAGNITKMSSTSNCSNQKSNIHSNDKICQHSKRRELVNLLEKSIASGDERAAAEAAMKLAQLRLSCSVLSFTSQILAGSSSSSENSKETHKTQLTDTTKINVTNQNLNNISKDAQNNKTQESPLRHTVIFNTPLNSSVVTVATSLMHNEPLKNSDFTTTDSVAEKRPSVSVTDTTCNELHKHKITTQTVTSTSDKGNYISPVLTEVSPSCSKQPTVQSSTQTNFLSTKIQNFKYSGSNNMCTKTSDSRNITPQANKIKQENGITVHTEAAAQKNVEASTSKEERKDIDDNTKSIAVWVEDKEKARGPIQMHVERDAVMGELRRQAEQLLGLPARLQRWIVGRALCNDDNAKLVTLAGPDLKAPFYLCLVECDTHNKPVSVVNKESKVALAEVAQKNSGDVYNELVRLESQATVPNAEAFECEVCMENCGAGDGIVLRECVHSFCRQCLSDVIRHCEEPAVPCPAMGCPGFLHEREIRALVSSEEYERWLARGLAAAESGTRNAFHCRTRDCSGWALCDAGVTRFPCPVCKHTNCVPCVAIHEGETCGQYRTKLEEVSNVNTAVDKAEQGTQALIQSLISRGEALLCPECSAVITKKWGCDWVKCSACKTEICWVTRGHRWGPGGRGDTSGGCKCGVDGKRCHPSCGYCH